MLLPLIVLSAGLFILFVAVHEIRVQRRLRREGVQTQGIVVRYERTQDSEGGSADFAVVGFADEQGRMHEVRSFRSGTRGWPIGRQVPVVYLARRPGDARIDLAGQHRLRMVLLTFGGSAFTVAAAVILARR